MYGIDLLSQLGILQTLQDAPFLRFVQRGRERLVFLFQLFIRATLGILQFAVQVVRTSSVKNALFTGRGGQAARCLQKSNIDDRQQEKVC